MIEQLIAKFQDYGLLLSDQEIKAGQEAIPILQDEDIADVLWLAAKFQPTEKTSENLPDPPKTSNEEEGTPTEVDSEEVDSDPDQSLQTSQEQPPSPVISAYIPDHTQQETQPEIEDTGEELPIQVKAAAALPNSLEMSRSLRPLMRKVPSRSRFEFDELATVERIAKRDIWVPILKPAPERWLEIELVIEDSQFCFVWQDTLSEFQHLLEHHGAFRNIRTWHLNSLNTDEPRLFSKKAPRNGAVPSLMRSPKELVDPAGRRLILVVSDCRSQIWQNGQIHEWLSLWSKAGPLAVVQLLPQRLWSQSELDVGYTVQLSSLVAGCPNGRLKVRGLSPRTIISDNSNLTFPVVTLAPKALKQWALVVAAAGRQRCPGRLFDLSWVNDPDRDQDIPLYSTTHIR